MSKAAVMALFELAGTPLGNTLNLDVDCVLGLLAALVPIKLRLNQSSSQGGGYFGALCGVCYWFVVKLC